VEPGIGQDEGIRRANLKKQRTAMLSIASNTLLVIIKLAVGLAIGSVSIISEAIHSGIDLVASIVDFISVKKSSEPPDSAHSFGHGKYESLSGIIEAILILVAAVLIVYEAAMRLLYGGGELNEGLLGAGILVMFISSAANWLVSSRMLKVAKETESIALEADAMHLRTDVYTSLGIFAGLVAIAVTGWKFLDPVFAIAVALFIVKAAYELGARALSDLIDRSLPAEDETRIRAIISEHYLQYASFHELRTRKSGSDRFMDLHLVVSKNLTVSEAHSLSDHLEDDLRRVFPRSSITIHVEPCEMQCEACECNSTCKDRVYRESHSE